jgi:hypothetical protein
LHMDLKNSSGFFSGVWFQEIQSSYSLFASLKIVAWEFILSCTNSPTKHILTSQDIKFCSL